MSRTEYWNPIVSHLNFSQTNILDRLRSNMSQPVVSRASQINTARRTSSSSGTTRPASSSGSSVVSNAITTANNANLRNAPAIGRTATGMAREAASTLDPFASDQFYNALETAFPGYREMFSQMQGNTMDMLQGRVPTDVADMVRMYSAEQGMQGAHASTARNLGLTSLDMATQGHSQGMDLFGLSKNYLTAPTYDVFAATDQIRGQLLAAGLITPAQAGQLQLEANAQRLQQQDADRMYDLQSRKMDMDASMFNAEMSWARELSALNRSWEQMVFNTQRGLYQDAVSARAKEQSALLDAFSNVSSTLLADQPQSGGTTYGSTAKPGTVAPTSPAKTIPVKTEGGWEDGPSYTLPKDNPGVWY